MRSLEIGLVLPMGEFFAQGSTVRWTEVRELAVRAETLGFDTVWTADAGYTQVEVLIWPPTVVALEAMAPGLELLDSD